MTWLTWRQFRAQALVAICGLAVLGIYLIITGPHISHVFNYQAHHCPAGERCDPLGNNKTAALTKLIPEFNDLVTLMPALIGMFWGAPLVAREIESGAIRLVFTQSISRAQWIRSKILFVGLASTVVAALTSLMVTWWARTWDHYNGLPFGTFDTRDIVPIAYSNFSFALGVLIGLLLRRTIPAMAATLVLYGALNAAFGQYVRPHLPGFDVDSRYWTLQWTESLIYLAMALALSYCSLWWIRRRFG